MTQIRGELERLCEALQNPSSVQSPELLAEELACRSLDQEYRWDHDALSARFESPTGLSFEVAGNEREQNVAITVQWMRPNVSVHYSNVTKWLPRAGNQAGAVLRKAGWELVGGTTVGQTVGVKARIDKNALRNSIDEASVSVRKAIEFLTFKG